MERRIYSDAIFLIQKEEQKVTWEKGKIIQESHRMTILLNAQLTELKKNISQEGFSDEAEEIEFFKTIKPQLLGKLIYYNKVYRMEISCPVNGGKMYYKYFESQLEDLNKTYEEHIYNTDFFRYYKSGRTDLDDKYFRLGNIDLISGLNSFVFEIDTQFSTYYDYQIARIIANDLLYNYLLTKIHFEEMDASLAIPNRYKKELYWSEKNSALTELIYALYASQAISNGRIGIRKISSTFEVLFRVKLGDLHHTFHRMKNRTGSRTIFLDYLKKCLETYMDKNI